MAFHLPERKRITRWAYFRVRERHKVHKLSCQPNCSQGPEIHIHRYQASLKLHPVLNKPFHTPNEPHSSSCFLSTCLLPGQPCSLSKLLHTAGHSPIHPRHLGPALLLPPDLVWAALHSTEGPFLNEITESWACLMPPKLLTQLGCPFPLPALYWTFSCLRTEHRSTEGLSYACPSPWEPTQLAPSWFFCRCHSITSKNDFEPIPVDFKISHVYPVILALLLCLTPSIWSVVSNFWQFTYYSTSNTCAKKERFSTVLFMALISVQHMHYHSIGTHSLINDGKEKII